MTMSEWRAEYLRKLKDGEVGKPKTPLGLIETLEIRTWARTHLNMDRLWEQYGDELETMAEDANPVLADEDVKGMLQEKFGP